MDFFSRILLDTLMQILVMLRHLVAEIPPFKFNDYHAILTGASDLKHFVGGVCMPCMICLHDNNTDHYVN